VGGWAVSHVLAGPALGTGGCHVVCGMLGAR
jgi:hypothetical protein